MGVSFSCIRALYRFWRAHAGVPLPEGVCTYVRGCVVHSNAASVWSCSVVIWSNLEAINRGGGIAFAWIYGIPIVRRWKNVNKAASLALFLSHHLNVSTSRLCRCSRYIYVFNVDGNDRFHRLALLPSIRDDPRRQLWRKGMGNIKCKINRATQTTPSPRNRY